MHPFRPQDADDKRAARGAESDSASPPASKPRWRVLGALLGALALAGALPGPAQADVPPWARPAADALRRAEREAEAALRAAPRDPERLVALGRARLDRTDLDGARAAFTEATLRDPGLAAAWRGLAEVDLAAHEPAAAARALARIATQDAGTLRLRAEVAIERGHPQAAWALAARALRLAPGEAEVTATAARAAYRAGRLPTARRLYAATVRQAPWHEAANLRLGSGFSPDGRPPHFGSQEERRRFDAATAAWRRDDLETALDGYADLVRGAPTAARYRLGLGLVLRERGWREARGWGEATDEEARGDGVPVPGEDQLVPGFARLPAWQQGVLRRSLAPAARWLPRLLAAGARHEVLLLEAGLTDAPERAELVDQLTFDGRWYAHLRGVGGLVAATGEEKLRWAARHEFDTFAHEFAHQLLTYGLTDALRSEVLALYVDACGRGACLDSYAASNVDEYFAQGFEAWISARKRPGVRHTASHTRAELARRDPPLHDLLSRVLAP